MAKNEEKKSNGKIKQAIFTKETLGVVTILFCTLSLICLITRDKVFSVPGELVNSFLFGCFGVFAFLVVIGLIVLGVKALTGKPRDINKKSFALLTVFMLSVALMSHVISLGNNYSTYGEYLSNSYLWATAGGITTCSAGGIFTGLIAFPFYALFGAVGSAVIFGVLGLACAFFFVRNVIDQNSAVSKKGARFKFRSTYSVAKENENLGVEIAGVKDYPIEGAVPVTDATKKPPQKLFINNEEDFAFMTKKEKTKDDAHIKINTENGGINVSTNNGTYTKNYVDDLNEKIAYIKTPAKIDTSGVTKTNGYYNPGVSTTIPRTPETIKPLERKEETVSKPVEEVKDTDTTTTTTSTERAIPFIEHNEETKPNDAVARARAYYERYMNPNVERTEETTTETTETTVEETTPVETTPVETTTETTERVIPIIDETEDTTDVVETTVEEVDTASTKTEDTVIEDNVETTEITETTETTEVEDETEDNVPPSVVRESRVRKILLGDEDNTPIERPSYTSRVNADGNGGDDRTEVSFGRRDRVGASVPTTETKPEPEKPKKEIPPINRKYFAPPLDLLESHTPASDLPKENHEERKEIIRQTLEEFGINVEMQGVVQGPSITRYEIKMPAGISVKRVLNFDDDIQMRLAARSGVRIEAPIPGKNLVGIEVANSSSVMVGLKEVLVGMSGKTFKPDSLIFALGKDIVGTSKYDDLTKGPHYLIAGSSGSGKSVCMDVMLVSMLMRYSPEELRLILIDPKRVGLRKYEHLPHLLVDEIITEPKKALAVLQWAIEEMERRYGMFEKSGSFIDGISAYNQHIASDTVPKMPKIVIVIDEFGDLMTSVKKDLEIKIQILTQKARAAGIHIVLATQRPSANVVTGVIKTNLPSRIAFKVGNYTDSLIILDSKGAEKLLGNGDMLYRNATMSDSERYQGAFISGAEVYNIVTYIRDNNKAYFDDDLTEYLERAVKPKVEETAVEEGGGEKNEIDDFFLRALAFAINSGTVSISQIQRRFQVGYARAGGLIDKMERHGFISGFEGAKARNVLITKEEFEDRFGPISNY